jgi:hypothetical protein
MKDLFLYDQITARFPDALSCINQDHSDLPYVIVRELADWIAQKKQSEITPELITRIVEFRDWCHKQPRGEDASDDVYTIYVVSFFEELFRSESGRFLIRYLVSKDDLIGNIEYLKDWISEENLELVLKEIQTHSDHQ